MLIKPGYKKFWNAAPVYGKAAGGGGGFSLSYKDNSGSTTTTTTINYPSVTWGSGQNAVIACIQWYNTNNTDVITGVTIGGNAATQISGVKTPSPSGVITADAWQLNSPVGTSGVVAVTYSVAPSYSSSVAVYGLVSTNTAGVGTNATNQANPAIAATQSTSVPTGGAAIVISGSQSGGVITLTSATSDAVNIGGGDIYNDYAHTTSTGSVTVTATPAAAQVVTLGLIAYGP